MHFVLMAVFTQHPRFLVEFVFIRQLIWLPSRGSHLHRKSPELMSTKPILDGMMLCSAMSNSASSYTTVYSSSVIRLGVIVIIVCRGLIIDIIAVCLSDYLSTSSCDWHRFGMR